MPWQQAGANDYNIRILVDTFIHVLHFSFSTGLMQVWHVASFLAMLLGDNNKVELISYLLYCIQCILVSLGT